MGWFGKDKRQGWPVTAPIIEPVKQPERVQVLR